MVHFTAQSLFQDMLLAQNVKVGLLCLTWSFLEHWLCTEIRLKGDWTPGCQMISFSSSTANSIVISKQTHYIPAILSTGESLMIPNHVHFGSLSMKAGTNQDYTYSCH